MKKWILTVTLAFICSMQLMAQNRGGADYRNAIGVKFFPGAVTYKHFATNSRAVEGLVNFWDKGIRFTGLYEFHFDIMGVNGLRWYVGPGAHLGFYNKNKNNDNFGGVGIGIDGVIGLDYTFSGAPVNLALDWQPSVEFGNHFNSGFTGNWGGVAIRYVF